MRAGSGSTWGAKKEGENWGSSLSKAFHTERKKNPHLETWNKIWRGGIPPCMAWLKFPLVYKCFLVAGVSRKKGEITESDANIRYGEGGG